MDKPAKHHLSKDKKHSPEHPLQNARYVDYSKLPTLLSFDFIGKHVKLGGNDNPDIYVKDT